MASVNIAGLQVDPIKVISILKTRLAEEQAKSALLEAALQDYQEREQQAQEQQVQVVQEQVPGQE
jgi:hypothetical protein